MANKPKTTVAVAQTTNGIRADSANERLCDDFRQMRVGATSPKAATVVLAYFFGTVPGLPPDAYEAQIRQQLVAAGATSEAAAAEMKWLDGCFATYVPDAAHRSGG